MTIYEMIQVHKKMHVDLIVADEYSDTFIGAPYSTEKEIACLRSRLLSHEWTVLEKNILLYPVSSVDELAAKARFIAEINDSAVEDPESLTLEELAYWSTARDLQKLQAGCEPSEMASIFSEYRGVKAKASQIPPDVENEDLEQARESLEKVIFATPACSLGEVAAKVAIAKGREREDFQASIYEDIERLSCYPPEAAY